MGEMIIDLDDVLKRLLDDKELVVELIEIFLDDTSKRIEEAKQSIDKKDCAQVADIAHSIKGAAANIGAKKLWKSFLDIEEMAHKQDLSEAPAVIQRAVVEFEELKAYFPSLKSDLENKS